MPEASIVVKSTDRYSETVKKMATVTKSFSKDVDKLEDTLYALNKNKYSLKLDASKAKAELKAAEKQFDLTHSAADGLKGTGSSQLRQYCSQHEKGIRCRPGH